MPYHDVNIFEINRVTRAAVYQNYPNTWELCKSIWSLGPDNQWQLHTHTIQDYRYLVWLFTFFLDAQWLDYNEERRNEDGIF